MNTNIKKILTWLFFELCCINCIYCADFLEDFHIVRFFMNFSPNCSPTYMEIGVGNQYVPRVVAPFTASFYENIYSLSPDKQYYKIIGHCPNGQTNSFQIPYCSNMRFKFVINSSHALEIEGPVYIDDVVLSDGTTDLEYACPDQCQYVKIKYKTLPIQTGQSITLFDNFEYANIFLLGEAYIECKNEGGEWTRLQSIHDNLTTITNIPGIYERYTCIPYTLLLDKQGLDPHKKMYFRTAKYIDGLYATSTCAKGIYYFPQFQFPAGSSLKIEPPACQGGNTIIKIPYEGTTDYTITVKGTNDYSFGGNLSLLDCSKETIDGITYYLLLVNLETGDYKLVIENKAEVGSPCPFDTAFTVPFVPAFTMGTASYSTYQDYAGHTIHIPKRGEKAQVSFPISNSKNQAVTVYVGSESFSGTLTSLVLVDGFTYYQGTVTIDLPAGTYNNIYVKNVSNCRADYPGTVTIKETEAIAFTLSPFNPQCNTGQGRVELSNITGGTGGYKYGLDNDSRQSFSTSTVTITGISSDSHNVTIEDKDGNVLTKSFSIAPAPSAVTLTSGIEVTPPTTFGGTDGQATISVSGGTPSYQYGKNDTDFQSSNILTGFSSGEKTVYVKDANGCLYSFNIIMPEGRQITIDSSTPVAPACNGGGDGSCVLVIGNLEGFLSVFGLPSDCTCGISGNVITIGNLFAGAYSFTIMETYNGKTNNIPALITIPQGSVINIETTVTPVSNKGTAIGKIAVGVSGGNSGTYRVVLLDEQDNQLAENNTAGNCIFENLAGAYANNGKLYKIKVYDSKNCSNEKTERIPEPEIKATLATPVSCYGNSDAVINILAEGGWGDYLYSNDNATWNNRITFANLPAGAYQFYVKDKNGGTTTTTITVDNPQPLDIIAQSITDAACFASSTGSICFRVSGGTAPYSLTPAIGTVGAVTENDITYLTISDLPASTYTFTLKDTHNCSLQAAQATIGQPAELTVSTSNLTQPVCGWSNGSLTATASGGIAPYIYTLTVTGTDVAVQTQTSSAAVQFESIAAGNYYIAVTDKNGCTKQSALLTFNQYISPAISGALVNDVVCFGESNGKITATAQKGTANINYFTLTKILDNTVIQSASGIFENLPAGNYVLYVFDTNGCQSQNAYPVVVKQPGELRIEVDTIVPVISKGANDGKIQFRVLGGNTGSAVVHLKNNENTTTTDLTVIKVIKGFTNELSVGTGTYTLEVTDSKDCSFTTELLPVEEPADSLRLIIKEVKDALCKSQTGKITVEGQGGWDGYRYKRAIDGQYATLNHFENLYPGTYSITVMDKMGATTTQSVTVYEPQDSLKAEIINTQLPVCSGNGALSIALSGGTAPYKLFSGNGNDTIFAAVPATVQWVNVAIGTLMLHLTDANGCKFELETVVSDTALLHIHGFEIIPPDVPQGANGSIRAKVSGGTSPLSYSWRKIGNAVSFPDNPLINNLSSGYYELRVTDGSSCSVIKPVYLLDPDDETLSVVKTGDETAINAANGYAVLYPVPDFTAVRVIDPENNYTDYPVTTNNTGFHISNDTIYLNNLQSGEWVVIGTNAAGQHAFAGFEIKPYQAFVFGIIEVIPVSTPGGSDGSISVEIQGGAGENTFVWTDEQGNILASGNEEYSTRLNNLSAGKYTLTVTDKYGNTIAREIEVLAPAQALQLTALEQKNQSCNGTVDAYVVLSAIGGWGNYRYAHERQPQNNNFEYNNAEVYSGLETSEHYFYVVDKYGKTSRMEITVTEPDVLRAGVANIENVTCKDEANGQVTFHISGGNAPYYFKILGTTVWKKGNVATNLPAGEYTFEFTDSLQCTSPDILAVTITEPDSLLFRNIDVTHTTCGEDNGQIGVALKGGTRPYTYQWKDAGDNIAGTDSIISGLKQSALYRLYVTDKNGCTQYLEQLIQPSKSSRITSVETTGVLCYGDSTGTARITEVEAGEPYSLYAFTWSNGTTGDFTGNLPAGRHSVTVSDENNCATTYYFDITQPDSLYLLVTDYLEPHCFGYSDGYIHTRTFGGAGVYTYLWSNGATTPGIDNIKKGDYWVRVTDENGCVFEKQFTLDEPAYQYIDLGEDLMMCPGNTHVIDGGNYVSYRWFTDKGDISHDRYLPVTQEDRYYLEAKTPDGCSAWGDIEISIGNNALRADMLLASEAAVGDTLVIFELSNLALDSLRWEYDSAVFERISIQDEYYNLPYVLQLRCLQTGLYNIGLAAYSGGCYSPVVKQVEVVEARDREEDDGWGAKGPVIQSLNQYPNPTNGIFVVELELREPSEVRLIVFEVASGICVDQRTETGSDYYNVSYNLDYLQSSVYVLIVTAGNERRQIKIVIE